MKKNFEVVPLPRHHSPSSTSGSSPALPNAKTNPEQRDLYDAFAKGDVGKIKQTPREQRKQLFLTTMSIYYADDLEKAQFRTSAGATAGRLDA